MPFLRALCAFAVNAFLLLILLNACATPFPPARSIARAVALTSDGLRLAAVNPDSDSVTWVDLTTGSRRAETAVGDDPRTLVFTPDDQQLLVANHGAGTLSRVNLDQKIETLALGLGSQPYGVVTNGQQAYVSLAALGQIAVVDLDTFTVTARLSVEPFPTGLALDGGALYITHLHSGRVTRLNLATQKVEWVAALTAQATLAQFITLSLDGTQLYVPHTEALADNVPLSYDSTIAPALTVLDAATGTPIKTLDLTTIDQPVSLPFAAALDDAGQTLYVLHAGSDGVSVIDLAAEKLLTHLPTGSHPRGLALARDGSLYVNNTLSGTLSLFAADFAPQTPLTLTTLPLSPTLLLGKQLFNSAQPPLSTGWVACASCHFDGGADGRTWRGFPDGPRNTPTLGLVGQTGPWHWSGDLDELQDVELTIRNIHFGAGLLPDAASKTTPPNAGRSAALDALAAYVASLPMPLSPHNQADGTLTPAAARGEALFVFYGCAACHPAPLYTDQLPHFSPIGDPALELNPLGLQMDTPSLLGAWATAPYFHDGSAATLRDVLFSPGAHNIGPTLDEAALSDLLAFLQALPATD